MKRSEKWDLTALSAHYQSWTRSETNRRLYRDNPRAELPALLENLDAPAAPLLAANQLDDLALWENKYGAFLVLDGDPAGWQHLRLALEIWELTLRIRRHEYAKSCAFGRPLSVALIHSQLARCFVQAVTLKHDTLAGWCGRCMTSELASPTGFLQGWDLTPFHPLTAWLYVIWQGMQTSWDGLKVQNLGVYKPLVDGWRDDSTFLAAITDACEYHCAHSDPDLDRAEFWHSPLDVFPCDILAILRIRREVLGSSATPGHPLLGSLLCSVPDTIRPLADSLVQDVAKRVLPGIATERQ